MADSIRLIDFALQETGDGHIILRGVLDPASLWLLEVADYQRDIIAEAKIQQMAKAIWNGADLPDITLGMRGQRCREANEAYFLFDPVFIIDGLQRTTAARRVMEHDPEANPLLGAKIYFGTTEETERDMFETLNSTQTKVSPNVTLYNLRHRNPAVFELFRLTDNAAFVMHGRVCWRQNMQRGQLITATTLLKAVARLQAHMGPGRGSSAVDVAQGLEKILENIGKPAFVANVRMFFDVIDGCWGVQQVAYRNNANQLKLSFLLALAGVFSDHLNFWKDDRLFIDATQRKKLASFPLTDPSVAALASSGGEARKVLTQMIVNHLNSGRRSKRLEARHWGEVPILDQADPDTEDGSE